MVGNSRHGVCRTLFRTSVNNLTVKKTILFVVIILGALLYFISSLFTPSMHNGFVHSPPEPSFRCRYNPDGGLRGPPSPINDHDSSASLRSDAKVLVFVETQFSRLGREICIILEGNRIKYKLEVAGKSLPLLTNLGKGKYSVIVFENWDRYVNMDKWNRELLDKYCREFKVGLVGFMPIQPEILENVQVKGFPLFINTKVVLRDCKVNPLSPILRVTRAGEVATGQLPGEDWTVFQANHSTYVPLATAHALHAPSNDVVVGAEVVSSSHHQSNVSPPFSNNSNSLVTVVEDRGTLDGIRRVLFGNGFKFWLHRLLFLDALSYLSHGTLSISLQRYILIDVDDIFVGRKDTRMTDDDVEALLSSQDRLQRLVPGFRFNLGFSGFYFNTGSKSENRGDVLLLENVEKFWWFCHMWRHAQPHIFNNVTELEEEMKRNRQFAKEHNIPVDSGYSVAPHHSGVYPVHEPLYEAWKKVWNVRVTSTEEYPHLRPARLRRGFIHRNIMVMPRQTCGLYTHTIYIDQYPGGRQKLESSIHGGELFQSIVQNPINIFMTHMSNYGNDRLALFTFESVIKFVQCWTNLQLQSIPPLQLGEKYFHMYPEETDPVWMNPCDDKRHQAIWNIKKSCDQLPRFLVIGPQKTGTTALYTFLSMHPAIISNYPSPETFEEVQFFNGKNYFKGLDWYMSFFPIPQNSTAKFLFEKSATYFEGELVPMRAAALLPRAKLVTILISPIKRAYSWYQHMRSHMDEMALNYTFYQVVTADEKSSKRLRELRNRCLNPGIYAQHLERWLTYYSPQQLMIVDGEQLKTDPVNVMNKLQRFLKIKPFFDYADHLRFDSKKGFFCQVVSDDKMKCLGKSKGRQYSPMDPIAVKYLQTFYLSHNVALSKLLTRIGQAVPDWLQKDLSDGQ